LGSYDQGDYSLGGRNPTLGSETDDRGIKGIMDKSYTSAYPANAAFWVQGSIDTRFKVGDQTLYSMLYGDNQWYQARRFFFNLVKRATNMICGRQRQNRKSTVAMPLHNDDSLADDYNTVIKWTENRDGYQEYQSQAFEGAVTTGMSLLHLYPDYTMDPISGDLFTDQVSYQNFLIDPYFRKQDLTDCAFIWRRRWVNKTQAKSLLPGKAEQIDKMKSNGVKDGRFPLQAELLNLNTSGLFTYDEYHYRSTREATIVLDPKTGEATEWEPEEGDPEDLLERTLQEQPWLVVTKKQVPTVKLVICIGGEVVYHGPNLLNIDDYPFVPVLCYHEPDIQSYAWRLSGVVRNMRDAQYLYNMRKVIEMDILQSQVNSGWIYPIDAVVDPKAFRQSGQGFLIPLKAGHLPNELQRIEAPSIPQSMLELSRGLAEDITKISGVNEELLGAATDDQSGILSMLRQGAGLVTLQTIFDKLDYSQRLFGKIRLQAIRKNFSKGKVRSILGRDPDPRFFSSYSLKYSIAVEEANYSTTQRQMELQQLLHFKQIGMPIPDKSILSAAFITNKREVMEDMQEQAQAQQQQQQSQMKSEEAIKQADVMVKVAKSRSDLASEKEKLARVNELNSESQHNRMKSDLEMLQMMIGLEDMDLENLRKNFELAQAIKEANLVTNQQTISQGGTL